MNLRNIVHRLSQGTARGLCATAHPDFLASCAAPPLLLLTAIGPPFPLSSASQGGNPRGHDPRRRRFPGILAELRGSGKIRLSPPPRIEGCGH